jgi:isopenicillin N synthase-like dioxygenase
MADHLEFNTGVTGARKPLEMLPVIDFERYRHGDFGGRVSISRAIGEACRHIGCFYIVNHGITPELVSRTFAEAKRFFDLPAGRKAEIAIEKSTCHSGYYALGGESLDRSQPAKDGDFKEQIKIGRDLPPKHPLVRCATPMHGPAQWPQDLPGWQGAMRSYADAMAVLCNQIMRSFALALDLDECFFDQVLTEPMTMLGPLHYPPQHHRAAERRIGVGAHTDISCVVIIAQDDVGGLQVRNAAGEWIDAPPIADSLVVNVGAMMARWTNDIFVPSTHRVLSVSGTERFSLSFSLDPNFDAELSALPTCTGPDNPRRYPPTTAGKYLLERSIDTIDDYADRGAAG